MPNFLEKVSSSFKESTAAGSKKRKKNKSSESSVFSTLAKKVQSLSEAGAFGTRRKVTDKTRRSRK